MMNLRYFLPLLVLALLPACEDTNIAMMADATTEAVTALTLSDEDVRTLAHRAALDADGKHSVANAGNPYQSRLRALTAKHLLRDGKLFNFKVYLTNEVNAFAMADGSVRVYSGLMELMNDEELLFVKMKDAGYPLLSRRSINSPSWPDDTLSCQATLIPKRERKDFSREMRIKMRLKILSLGNWLRKQGKFS
jgi:hypothetical protein